MRPKRIHIHSFTDLLYVGLIFKKKKCIHILENASPENSWPRIKPFAMHHTQEKPRQTVTISHIRFVECNIFLSAVNTHEQHFTIIIICEFSGWGDVESVPTIAFREPWLQN